MSGPKVSIILPNFNHARFLDQRIESIINQTYQNFELLIFDDASTDESVDVIKKYEDRVDKLVVNRKNSGSPFHQWKKGLAQATGDWIWIAESDDYCELDFLETLLSKVDDQVNLIYSNTYDVRDGEIVLDRTDTTTEFNPNIWEADFTLEGKDFVSNYLKVKNVIPNASAVIFRKSAAQDLIDTEMTQMRMCGDWLFWIKMLESGSLSFVHEHLNYFRFHLDSSRTHRSFDRIAGRIAEEAIIREHLATMGIKQSVELEALQKKWYKIHRIGQWNDPEFKKLNRHGIFKSFLSQFVTGKFLRKW